MRNREDSGEEMDRGKRSGDGGSGRVKMPLEQRAKQFIPFSALSGLEAALKAKEREMGLADTAESCEVEI